MSDKEARRVNELFDLSERVALVTGATGQLGYAMATALAEQGAHIAVNARTASSCKTLANSLSEKHNRAIPTPGDVTEESDVSRVVAEIESEFGQLDILVNNAYDGSIKAFEEMSGFEFTDAFHKAVTSTFLTTKTALPLLQRDGGSIINIASIYGVVAPDHRIYGNTKLNNPPHYGAAKAGVIQFTRWLATKFAEDDIRANAVTPGGIYDESLSRLDDYEGEFVPNYEDRTPLGRMGTPEDLKGPVAFLASDASQWMTGQNLIVDGGWTAW